ncbi:hypothetical protein MOUSESFB_1018 [Candidatus Arthromitus sp. SFB-mouse-Yit]|nr:hypothetical protein MOUSESFB_1018 [Candidatus Arthromitus sp. SFB-mouse-Yit]
MYYYRYKGEVLVEVLDTLLCKKFKDEDIFLEKVQDILNYDIIEYIYRDVFDFLGNIYYKIRIRLENEYMVEFVYYFLEDDAICILDIEY